MDLPPAPTPQPTPMPAPGWPPETPTSSSRRTVLIAAIVFGALAAIAVAAFLTGRGDGLPDEVLGYERLQGGDAARTEDFMESIRIGDLEINAAVYGEGDTPRLVAVLYANYPGGVPIGTIVDGMSQGMEQSGGTVNERSLQTIADVGHELACVEAGGPGLLVPGGPSEEGVACVFHGDTTGLVITTHTTNSIQGIHDVRAFVEAYRSA